MIFLESHAEMNISKKLFQFHCGARKVNELDHDWFMGEGCLAILKMDQYFPYKNFNFEVGESSIKTCELTNELIECVKLKITEKEVKKND